MFANLTVSSTNRTRPSNLHDYHPDMKPMNSSNSFLKPTSRRLVKSGALAVAVAIASSAASVDAAVLTFWTGTLSIAPTGKFDLKNNLLVVNTGSVATITGYIKTGLYNGPNGYWDGPGIDSSNAAVDATQTHAVGILDNSLAGYTTFGAATPLPGTAILTRYTYFGDADLDGSVTPADYSLIDAGLADYQTNGPSYTNNGWLFGDFDYDGIVSPGDYSLIDAGRAQFLISGAIPPAPSLVGSDTKGSSVVPEPGSAGLLAAGLIGLMTFRRPNKRK